MELLKLCQAQQNETHLQDVPFWTVKNSAVRKYFVVNGGVTRGKESISAAVKSDQIGALISTKTEDALMAGVKYELLHGGYILFLADKEFNPPNVDKIESVGVDLDVVIEPCEIYCQDPDL